MSERLTQGLSIGIVGLLIFAIIMFGYLIIENQQTADDSNKAIIEQDKNIEQINATLNTFVDNWENRIKVSNEVNNSTQRQLLALAHNQTKVLQTQISNEKNILGNLTAHRHVANFTRDQVLNATDLLYEQENQLLDLQNKTNSLTGPEYEKLADIRVNNIVNWTVGNLTKNNINNNDVFGDVIGDASKGEDQ
ncbi:MAG TPA: hypothetical protein VL854_08055 [Nitrososphaeraceae archaeon]|nr:hypothetical protein [Nitrososphaeraceae archaeon]